MPPHLRRAGALTLATLALLVPTAATQAVSDHGDAPRDGSRGEAPLDAGALHRLDLAGVVTTGPGAALKGTSSVPFVGTNGVSYDPAPLAVYGGDGRVFFGQDFDAACAYGNELDDALGQLTKLARVIERSGRHVVFTVAPNKSSVTTGDLPAELPHGSCDARGLRQQNRVLDRFTHRDFVPLRAKLERQAARGANVYWRLDTHWTTVAASEYAQAVARKLNPRIADLQTYRTKRVTIPVDIAVLLDQSKESGRVHVPTTPVKVRPAGTSPEYDPDTVIAPDLSWRTGPASRTWRGDTLLLGDSFTYRGLPVLMPLFRHGRFMWLNAVDNADILNAIPKSETVVIEVVQRYAAASVLVQTDFRDAVKRALRDYDSRR